MSKEAEAYITATCQHCKKAYLEACKATYFRETPSENKLCPECKKKCVKRIKKKRNYSPEQIEAFKERMKKSREEKQK